jgi:hypothetical protein
MPFLLLLVGIGAFVLLSGSPAPAATAAPKQWYLLAADAPIVAGMNYRVTLLPVTGKTSDDGATTLSSLSSVQSGAGVTTLDPPYPGWPANDSGPERWHYQFIATTSVPSFNWAPGTMVYVYA